MRTRLPDCCADWPTSGSRQRYGRCTLTSPARGPSPCSPSRRPSRVQHFSHGRPHRRRYADGIPAGLANGRRQRSAPPAGHQRWRGGRTRRLRLGEHLQHRVHGTGASPRLVSGARVRRARRSHDNRARAEPISKRWFRHSDGTLGIGDTVWRERVRLCYPGVTSRLGASNSRPVNELR